MSFIRATGVHLPSRVVGNDELAAAVGEPAAWIEQVSGIRERRYAAEGETVVTQALSAAQACLDRAGVTASDVSMLLLSSGSADRNVPGPAAQVAAELGMGTAPALDIAIPSAGSLWALCLAKQMAPLAAGGKVLVVASEIMSRRVDRFAEGKNTAILFGDGAASALIDASAGALRLGDAVLQSDGTGAEILHMTGSGDAARLHMDGGSVILRASRKLPAVTQELLTRNHLSADAVTRFVMHQANGNLILKVAATLKVPADRFFQNIARYGNTSSASLLIALHEFLEETPSPTGPVVLSAFGAGLNWGAMLATPA
ncbi:3-oxoacyl-ACP synthase III family protein [Terriglobus aquaticus]|uniref:3-oxoacyl-ACP synthase III family protein n=1 Tax=Terriglobus aquaticus TaxID=940139 RepID=A0ABW9KHY5_9BACT|nr:ketoacyl-ACP synthase III [Terriglobus aquaticus]